MKFTILILLFLCPAHLLFGQGWVVEDNNFETNWSISIQVGRTALLGEINKDFSGSSNDMNNMSDWGYNLQLSKMIFDRFDIGLEFGISNYKGFKKNSSNVNWLMLDKMFNNLESDFKPYAIYYDSDVTNFTFFGKYNFINFSSWTKGYIKINLYVKAGIGILFPSAEMGYTDKANYEFTGLSHPLYLKGRYPSPSKDMHLIISPAFGLNYQLTDRFFFSAESSFQLIGADNLDGIHNYSNELTLESSSTADYRVSVNDLTAKFMIGITYFFNFDTHKQTRNKQLPWFSNQYRSYYSKFHKTTTKKDRQERLPFYNDKFKEQE